MAGFLGFFDYNKPGKGVEKDEYQSRFSIFFSVLGRKFWKIIQLNMLYFILCIPILALIFRWAPLNLENEVQQVRDMFIFTTAVLLYISVMGFPPLITGVTFVLRNFSRQQHSWVYSDFFENVKKNFKQSIIVFAIDTVVIYLFYINISFYTTMQSQNTLMLISKIAFIIVGLVYFIMHFYMYQIMVTFDLSLKNIYKNSLIFTFSHLPKNIVILILISIVAFGTFCIGAELGIIISAIISIALISYIINFMVENTIAKYLMPPENQVEE